MSVPKRLSACFVLAILAATLWSPPAQACSWARNAFRDGIRESEPIKGTIRITSIQPVGFATDGPYSDTTGRPLYKEIRGVVTDRRGRTFMVAYQTAFLGCSPFTVPETDISGVFYLKRLSGGEYELVHWKRD